MRTAIYPGSFDPPTFGHLDIIKRASKLFDNVIVVVMFNAKKNALFTPEERVELLKKLCADIPNIEIECSNELLAEFARKKGACVYIRGLRALSDFEYEFQMSLTNRKLNTDLETVFLTTKMEYMYLSSSIVKEVGGFGGDISSFVPEVILEDVKKKISCNR